MEHGNEILGTLMVVMFDLLVAFFVYVFALANVSLAFRVVSILVFGGTALWATYEVCAYWYRKVKSKTNNNQ